LALSSILLYPIIDINPSIQEKEYDALLSRTIHLATAVESFGPLPTLPFND
jgi:hypothetical protein